MVEVKLGCAMMVEVPRLILQAIAPALCVLEGRGSARWLGWGGVLDDTRTTCISMPGSRTGPVDEPVG